MTVGLPLAVTLVTARDCHLCDRAREVLSRLQGEIPMDVVEVDWASEAGGSLVQAEGVPFPPALYVGSSLVGYGRLSERVLRRRLADAMA